MVKKTLRVLIPLAMASLLRAVPGPEKAAADPSIRYSPRPSAVEGLSQCQISLNGTWQFNPAPQKSGAWARIQVPGDWTMQGFSVPPNAAASYKREIDIPAAWKGRRIKLRCDGVQSVAEITVNGKTVGAHLGGFTAFELDLTGFIQPGRSNTIALDVTNESTADELASGTQYAAYQFGGITRKIYLLALPETNLSSLQIATDPDGEAKDALLKVRLEAANEGAQRMTGLAARFALADAAGNPVSLPQTGMSFPDLGPGARAERTYEVKVAGPKKWDAEHPNLYVLTVDWTSGGKVLETVRQRFGFRTIEVVGNQVFVNGRPIKIRGVNRHETHPFLGRSLTPDLGWKDAELFRNANVNTIRTSHYPPAEEFLEACDELGLFVECEAPLVWISHNANEKWKKENPDSPVFLPLIKAAIAETIEFNRNHPSVIFWSMANESGWGPNFAVAKVMAEALDPSRPKTFHDQAVGGNNNKGSGILAIANYHYPSEAMLDDVQFFSRPLYFGEYCHVNCYNRQELAADPGVRDEYGRGFSRMWEMMTGTQACLGGSIWAGINDIFFLPSGKAVGYGDWGLIDGWRREKPEYWHVKKTYSPVRIPVEKIPAPLAGEPLKLQITNRHDFTNLNEMAIDWRIGDERGTASLDLLPRQTGILKILPVIPSLGGKILRLDFTSPRGFVVDSYEIAIGDIAPAAPPFKTTAPGTIRLKAEGDSLIVAGEAFAWTFDRKTGAVRNAEVGGAPVLIGGPTLMLLPQTTGPCVTDYSLDIKPLNSPCRDWAAEAVEVKEEPDAVTILVKGAYAEAEGGYKIRINNRGEAAVDYAFTVNDTINPRQYGLVFDLPRAFDTLTWKRKGQWSVYPADHIGRPEGTARAVVAGAEFKYRQAPANAWKDDMNELGSADFRSTKADVFWSALQSSAGPGLLLESDGRHATRAFLNKDRIGFLVADFNTGGGDLFFAGHHKAFDKPLAKGGVIKGAFTLRLIH